MLAKKVVILKKNHEFTLKKHGFGTTYPKKIFINTETGVNSGESTNSVGGDLVRRNWILKLALFCIEYDVKQVHLLNLADDGKGMGDYEKLGKYSSIEEGFTHLKNSSKGRLVLKKIHLGKFIFDETKSQSFRDSLPEGVTGIVLRRKVEKENDEEYYSDYIYSAWVYCEKEEVKKEIEIELNLDFNPLSINWLGVQKNLLGNSKLYVTSTPIFLIENNGNYEDTRSDTNSNENSNSFLFLNICIIFLSLILSY
jgi:hypothetical protein